MMTPFMCRGCEQPIMERYLMKVLDKSWHVQCVKCSKCQCLLSEKCFSRDSKLYCRNDFFRLYGTKCSGCNVGLCPEDLVRRAIDKVYHVHCFVCTMCKKQLSTGEQLNLVQGEGFLCDRCYQISAQSLAVAKTNAATTPTTHKQVSSAVQGIESQLQSTPNLSQHLAGGLINSSDGKRTKTRTSINPQQLEVLVLAYGKEQRPSKQTREDLMAKTGLDMKVIQVWFQNRRSKEKRDANYRDTTKEDNSGFSTPIGTPPTTVHPLATQSSIASPSYP